MYMCVVAIGHSSVRVMGLIMATVHDDNLLPYVNGDRNMSGWGGTFNLPKLTSIVYTPKCVRSVWVEKTGFHHDNGHSSM